MYILQCVFVLYHSPCNYNLPIIDFLVPSESPSSVATRATNNSILLTWLPPSPENQNGIIHRYRLEVLCLNTNESQQLMANESFFEISNLHPFYSYQITIAAETHAGIGPYSSPVIQQLPPAS